ncbi:unnamed protein product [marine sediment metagenome]|uniref:Uncharacterized protein n=1 Tax=marine sediment metagenome TaxID=412755 RepID=X1QJX6_9ZZZZ
MARIAGVEIPPNKKIRIGLSSKFPFYLIIIFDNPTQFVHLIFS